LLSADANAFTHKTWDQAVRDVSVTDTLVATQRKASAGRVVASASGATVRDRTEVGLSFSAGNTVFRTSVACTDTRVVAALVTASTAGTRRWGAHKGGIGYKATVVVAAIICNGLFFIALLSIATSVVLDKAVTAYRQDPVKVVRNNWLIVRCRAATSEQNNPILFYVESVDARAGNLVVAVVAWALHIWGFLKELEWSSQSRRLSQNVGRGLCHNVVESSLDRVLNSTDRSNISDNGTRELIENGAYDTRTTMNFIASGRGGTDDATHEEAIVELGPDVQEEVQVIRNANVGSVR
jgi:hypothetical protein